MTDATVTATATIASAALRTARGAYPAAPASRDLATAA